MKLATVARIIALLVLVGCGAVKVMPSGPAAEVKPDDCLIEFMEDPPTREYVELGTLVRRVTEVPASGPVVERTNRLVAAEMALRKHACRMGADAVIVTRVTITNAYGHMMVAGRAIKYLPPPPPPPLPEGSTLSL